MSRSIDSRSARWSALVDADTQFDLDLSDILDQYPDGTVRGAGGAVVAEPGPEPADADPVAGGSPRPTPFGAVVAAAAAAERFPGPAAGAVPVVADPPATAFAVPEPPARGHLTSVDVPVPRSESPTSVDPAVAAVVDPPTAVHPVFVTPPAGVPVVGPILPEPPAPAAAARPDRRTRRRARRRTRTLAVLAGVLAVALVAAGVGLAVATRDDGGDEAAASPGQSVDLPGADVAKPDDAGVAEPAAPADAPAVDDAAVGQAAGAVTSFLSVRGTDAERAVSSQGGRDQFDAALAASGATSAQGAPECSAGATAGTFACVLGTDRGPITLTVGADLDDPASSGFEVIGAAVA